MNSLFSALLPFLILASCVASRPVIKHDDIQVVGSKDGEKVILDSKQEESGFDVPAGSTYSLTRYDATPATNNTPYVPAYEFGQWSFADKTRFTQAAKQTSANTGTINISIAEKRIDVEERKPLLYCAIGCVIVAIFFVWKGYPTGTILGSVGAVAFGLAWKLDDLPDWFWIVGVAAVAVAIGIYFGYERKEEQIKEEKK